MLFVTLWKPPQSNHQTLWRIAALIKRVKGCAGQNGLASTLKPPTYPCIRLNVPCRLQSSRGLSVLPGTILVQFRSQVETYSHHYHSLVGTYPTKHTLVDYSYDACLQNSIKEPLPLPIVNLRRRRASPYASAFVLLWCNKWLRGYEPSSFVSAPRRLHYISAAIPVISFAWFITSRRRIL